jgi:hypothetical protein
MFYYDLAEKLGCTVDQLLSNITSEEITYWKARRIIKNEEQRKAEKAGRR